MCLVYEYQRKTIGKLVVKILERFGVAEEN